MGKTKGKLIIIIIYLLKGLPLETQRPIQYIHSDTGKKFAKVFKYAKSNHIKVSINTPYTPKKNPIAKRIIKLINIKVSVILK